MTDDITVSIAPPRPINVTVSSVGATGASAYALAVAQGFSGTLDEWLASLQGADGDPGPSAVSADAGNSAVLGTDDLIYVPASTAGASNWGDLGGTLSDQTDLQAALDGKADTTSLGTAATHAATDFATAAQGTLADSATQPGDLAAVATSGAYGDLSGTPTLGTAAAQNSTAFATAAQGAKADTALQVAPVTSVNTMVGAVTLTASDVGASPTGAYVKPGTGIPSTDMTTAVQTSLGKADTALQAAPVTSVASKTGAVTLAEGDIANLTTDLAAKAPLASPALTGSPTVPTQTTGDNSTKAASTAFVATAVAAGVATAQGAYVGINAQTGTTYSAVLSDVGKLVTCSNAAAIAVTLPKDATQAVPTASRIDFLVIGAGKVTFAAESGATVNGTPTLVSRAQYSAVTAIKTAANTWIIVGDLG